MHFLDLHPVSGFGSLPGFGAASDLSLRPGPVRQDGRIVVPRHHGPAVSKQRLIDRFGNHLRLADSSAVSGEVPQAETVEDLRRRLFRPEGAADRAQWLETLGERMRRGDIDGANTEAEEVLGLPAFYRGGSDCGFKGLEAPAWEALAVRNDLSTPEPTTLWYLLPVMQALQLNDSDVVCDIGSGIGKVVLLMAACTEVRQAFGIEIIEPYACFADELAAQLNLSERARFVHGDVLDADLSQANVFYLYNPFNIAKGAEISRIVADRLIALGAERDIKIAVKGSMANHLRAADAVFIEAKVAETAQVWTIFATRGSPLGKQIEDEQNRWWHAGQAGVIAGKERSARLSVPLEPLRDGTYGNAHNWLREIDGRLNAGIFNAELAGEIAANAPLLSLSDAVRRRSHAYLSKLYQSQGLVLDQDFDRAMADVAAARWCEEVGLPLADIVAEYTSHDWAASMNVLAPGRLSGPIGFSGFVRACQYAAIEPEVSKIEVANLERIVPRLAAGSSYQYMAHQECVVAQMWALDTLRRALGIEDLIPMRRPFDVLMHEFPPAPSACAQSPPTGLFRADVVWALLYAAAGPEWDRSWHDMPPDEAIVRSSVAKRAQTALKAVSSPVDVIPDGLPSHACTAAFGDSETVRRMRSALGEIRIPPRMSPLYPQPPRAALSMYGMRNIASAGAGYDPFARISGYAGSWQDGDRLAGRAIQWVGGYADAFGPSFTHWVGKLNAGSRVLILGAEAASLANSWTRPTKLDCELPLPAAKPEIVLEQSHPGLWQQEPKASFDGIVRRSPAGEPVALDSMLFEAGLLLKKGGLLFFDVPADGLAYRTEEGDPLSVQELFDHYIGGLALLPTQIHPHALILGDWQYGNRMAKVAERTGEPLRIPRCTHVRDSSTGEPVIVVSSAYALTHHGSAVSL
jgi:hypothetical protein